MLLSLGKNIFADNFTQENSPLHISAGRNQTWNPVFLTSINWSLTYISKLVAFSWSINLTLIKYFCTQNIFVQSNFKDFQVCCLKTSEINPDKENSSIENWYFLIFCQVTLIVRLESLAQKTFGFDNNLWKVCI